MVEGLKADREQFQNILSLGEALRNRSAPINGCVYCSDKGFDPGNI
jgi:hypothetical protein